MDGNRRFARARGESVAAAHLAGYDKVKEVLAWVKDLGITTVFLYAFSTENWGRQPVEVKALMTLFRRFLEAEIDELCQNETRLIFIGDLERLPSKLKQLAIDAMARTKAGKKFNLVIALSYGGRAELVAAAKTFARKFTGKLDQAGEPEFESCLLTAGLPDPDLIIRTGGAERLSNFLPWQSVYSELHFTPTHWPELERVELERIIANYYDRQRRFGK